MVRENARVGNVDVREEERREADTYQSTLGKYRPSMARLPELYNSPKVTRHVSGQLYQPYHRLHH